MADLHDVRLYNRLGQTRPLSALTTLFDLCLVVVDGRRPGQLRALRRLLERIDASLSGADCTVGLLAVGVDWKEAVAVAGPLAERMAIFADPDAAAAQALGIRRAPALLWVSTEPAVRGLLEGWEPSAWRAVLTELARKLAWTRPLIPAPGDPPPVPAQPLAALRVAADAN